jgi:hypothetical protein
MIARPPNQHAGVGSTGRPVRARRRRPQRFGTVGPTQAGLNQPAAPVAPRAAPLAKPQVAPYHAAPPAITYNGAPATADANALRANAQLALTGAQGSYRDQVYRAAMDLGDQGILNKLKADPQFAGYKFAVDPNSQFSQLGRALTEGNRNIDVNQNANNSFFSGFRLNERNEFGQDNARQKQGAASDYQDALTEYAKALAAAQGQYTNDMGQADQMDLEAAAAREPEARAAARPAGTSSGGPAANANAARAAAQRSRARASEAAATAEARSRARSKRARKRKH